MSQMTYKEEIIRYWKPYGNAETYDEVVYRAWWNQQIGYAYGRLHGVAFYKNQDGLPKLTDDYK